MDFLELVKLTDLMELTGGKPEIIIGLIDGPVAVNHPNLASENVRQIPGRASDGCAQASSIACMHGTFIAGILSANRGSQAPAICPGCTLLVRPIFSDALQASEWTPSTTPQELASAIIECIDAEASIINLSLAPDQLSPNDDQELEDALDYAVQRGVIVIAAAGNQASLGSTAITRHPWVIPVVACDLEGRPTTISNLGRSIGRYGLTAPGDDITSLGTDGKPLTFGGTSAATPFVTGAVALLWSEFPLASAAEIKYAVTQVYQQKRTTVVPPLLNAWATYQALAKSYQPTDRRKSTMDQIEDNMEQSVGTIDAQTILTASTSRVGATVIPQHCGEPGCQVPADSGSNETGVTQPSYAYALGRIEPRFPSLGLEKEFAQATGRGDTAGLTDRQATQSILSQPQNRYLARQLCWVLTIEGMETYILLPREASDLDMLLEAIRRTPAPIDIDVVIGRRGPIAPPSMCNGLQIPIVVFDQIYSFDRDALIKGLPRPEKAKEDQFTASANELLDRIMQMADNAGATDEHRALNYLSVRYPAIYAQTNELNGRDFSLTGVDVRSSRLSGTRKIVDVVLSYTNRSTDVSEKYFVRVDVTEEFPFLVTKLSPYFDR
jgi:hypothetical protein